jgi:glycosyltransferase involved in cell wall biosynthesis
MIDFCITTLDRYHLLEELLDSIFKYYPDVEVTVADQSKIIDTNFYNKYIHRNLRVFPLPYDCGLSKARNILVKETKKEYKLILEDDFLFTEKTDINHLLKLTDVADIVGGAVIKNEQRLKFEHYFIKTGQTIYQVSDGNIWEKHKGITFKRTGCVLNFFLAKKKVFDNTLWDERLKVREHQHFFYRVKDKIAFTPDVEIQDNKRGNHKDYIKLKSRDNFWKIALEDLGAKRIKYLTRQVVEIEGDKIVRYKYAIPRRKN